MLKYRLLFVVTFVLLLGSGPGVWAASTADRLRDQAASSLKKKSLSKLNSVSNSSPQTSETATAPQPERRGCEDGIVDLCPEDLRKATTSRVYEDDDLIWHRPSVISIHMIDVNDAGPDSAWGLTYDFAFENPFGPDFWADGTRAKTMFGLGAGYFKVDSVTAYPVYFSFYTSANWATISFNAGGWLIPDWKSVNGQPTAILKWSANRFFNPSLGVAFDARFKRVDVRLFQSLVYSNRNVSRVFALSLGYPF